MSRGYCKNCEHCKPNTILLQSKNIKIRVTRDSLVKAVLNKGTENNYCDTKLLFEHVDIV